MIIGAWLILYGISKSSEFAAVGSAVEVCFYYRGLAWIFKSSELAGVGSAVTGFLKVLNLLLLAPPLRLALIIGAWLVL